MRTKASFCSSYARYGFAPVEAVLGASAARPQPRPMFLAMRAIKAASGG